ncbi:hypothetical protein L596_024578 [Steinernema carpocapsae]|uniref:Uncharacterized protein n=1 Tax=Steinernema carpocapsae TaxID=34508 RepID=A0A4U5MH63_STECR|nr:hypothetical protein L596_024578 [Steinernema carpocapsae]
MVIEMVFLIPQGFSRFADVTFLNVKNLESGDETAENEYLFYKVICSPDLRFVIMAFNVYKHNAAICLNQALDALASASSARNPIGLNVTFTGLTVEKLRQHSDYLREKFNDATDLVVFYIFENLAKFVKNSGNYFGLFIIQA